MPQSSLKPGLLFQRCNSAYVTRLPVIWRTVSSAERQYVPRTSTSTPSTSKIRICGRGVFFIAFRDSPGIMGFPVSAEGMHAGPEAKCKKQDITVPERRRFHQERAIGSSKGRKERKKTHPACERAFCSSGMEGA